MKLFTIWLGISLSAFGLMAGSYHLYLSETPRRVLLVIDSSFPMQTVWRQVSDLVDDISAKPYSEFSVVTEKTKIHGWSKAPSLRGLTAFAPRDFSRLKTNNRYSEIDSATEIHLITTANDTETSGFDGWVVHRLRP